MTYERILQIFDEASANQWRTLSSKLALDERWFKVSVHSAETASGMHVPDYFVWRKPDAALVVPRTRSGKYLVTCQYKYGLDKVVVEFPGGEINAGETPRQAAVRELIEETGYAAATLRHCLTVNNDPTKESGVLYIFEGDDLGEYSKQSLDDTENVVVLEVDSSQVSRLIKEGRMSTTSSIAAWFWIQSKQSVQ